jgi:hypothetical protein
MDDGAIKPDAEAVGCTHPGITAAIDWTQPWLQAVKPLAMEILAEGGWRAGLNRAAAALAIRNHQGHPVQFVAQEDLLAGMAYESYISQTGCVPTRDNLHDFFNGLIWCHFPAVKVALNRLQSAELHKTGHSGAGVVRGKLRDGATIFDENAALFLTTNGAQADALRAHDWRSLLVAGRLLYGQHNEVRLFGHALIEKLVKPYKAITAHAWVLNISPEYFLLTEAQKAAWIDATVASQIQEGLSTASFTPLPVLGVPGWWPGQSAAFYDDVSVFRPRRKH